MKLKHKFVKLKIHIFRSLKQKDFTNWNFSIAGGEKTKIFFLI